MKTNIHITEIKTHMCVDEPMHCQAKNCSEELNGLNRYIIKLDKDFIFELWLCGDCSNIFKNKFRKTQSD